MATEATGTAARETVETKVPARLDRLPWSKFHWMVVIGLGTVWILDGLEVTIIGSIGDRLTEGGSGITLDASQIGSAAAFYVAGACFGALFFGQLTDRFGRKKLFLVTLGLYILATVATGFVWTAWYFFAARFVTGMGIGGEYAAINSAIDELIPARVRGRVDLIINGSYWVGALLTVPLLDTSIFAMDFGWRLAFLIGAVLGVGILIVRSSVPESPRRLFIHGRNEEAEQIVGQIEDEVREETGEELEEVPDDAAPAIHQRATIPFREIASVAIHRYPQRSVFGVSNFIGPLTLGRLFDTIGRKVMISLCYLTSAGLTAVLGIVLLSTTPSTLVFMAFVPAIFYFASSGASAAYLTVSEIVPMESRALSIAFFYAVGTAAGGIVGPLLFGELINTGELEKVAIGFLVGAVVMALGGIAEIFFGVHAEGKALESIAAPLSAARRRIAGSEIESGEEPPAAIV
ncbi:MAG TPA: MFS transporter [Solirubrobacterales bacterium]|nr:MFS transporter [Solirubrobacterales bacterium]